MENLFDIANRIDFQKPMIQNRVAAAHRYLGELKGACLSIPNQDILISTLTLQESEQSSAIENIFTTQDALYKSMLNPENTDPASKEVYRYVEALLKGYEIVKEKKSIELDTVEEVQGVLLPDDAGFRVEPGTVLKNRVTGEIIYRPPEHDELPPLLDEWGKFINDSSICRLDPLIKLALLHHQFESIHPFPDGNGRTGRILNILYLVKQDLLDSPILYLSRFIYQSKRDYYQLLQETRTQDRWEDWVIYILNGIYLTARNTLYLIQEIKNLLQKTKATIREEYPRIYSQDLLNNLFRHPYTKSQFLATESGISNDTATRYLNTLVEGQLLSKEKFGRNNYYFNNELINLLFNIPPIDFAQLREISNE